MQDETAKEMCELFFRALVQDGSNSRDYRRVFLSTTDSLRPSAYSRGSKTKTRDADDVSNSMSPGHSGTTQSLSPQEVESSRGRVMTCHKEDVVLFLSKDGDSDSIYLWRERPPLAPPSVQSDAIMMMHRTCRCGVGRCRPVSLI